MAQNFRSNWQESFLHSRTPGVPLSLSGEKTAMALRAIEGFFRVPGLDAAVTALRSSRLCGANHFRPRSQTEFGNEACRRRGHGMDARLKVLEEIPRLPVTESAADLAGVFSIGKCPLSSWSRDFSARKNPGSVRSHLSSMRKNSSSTWKSFFSMRKNSCSLWKSLFSMR